MVAASAATSGWRARSQLVATRSFATCQPASASAANARSAAAVAAAAEAPAGNAQTMSTSGSHDDRRAVVGGERRGQRLRGAARGGEVAAEPVAA